MAAFKLPRLKANLAIVDGKGRPLDYFLRLFNIEFAQRIEQNETSQDEAIEAIQALIEQVQINTIATQAAQQAANDAQATADAGTPGTKSGAATDPSVIVSPSVWSQGPQVDLTGVVAGNLTIQGSGPQQDEDVILTGGKGSGQFSFRIVEIISGVETVVFSGPFTATNTDYSVGPATIANTSSGSVSSFSSFRTSTGSVSYRIDATSTTSRRSLNELLLYIYVRRAA